MIPASPPRSGIAGVLCDCGIAIYGLNPLRQAHHSRGRRTADLAGLLGALAEIARDVPVIFPVHPRTRARVDAAGLSWGRITPLEPLTYLEFLMLQRRAALVITESGGVQEETTFLGVPCLTMRENTERPVTVTIGTNQLVGRDTNRMKIEASRILGGDAKRGAVPPLWDGKAADRIADHVISI